jgi:hypothetical protein
VKDPRSSIKLIMETAGRNWFALGAIASDGEWQSDFGPVDFSGPKEFRQRLVDKYIEVHQDHPGDLVAIASVLHDQGGTILPMDIVTPENISKKVDEWYSALVRGELPPQAVRQRPGDYLKHLDRLKKRPHKTKGLSINQIVQYRPKNVPKDFAIGYLVEARRTESYTWDPLDSWFAPQDAFLRRKIPEGEEIPFDEIDVDWSHEAGDKALEDCSKFFEKLGGHFSTELLKLHRTHKMEKAGRDFWLTRNQYGAGFWDGDYPESIEGELVNTADSFPAIHLIMGAEGLLHFYPYRRDVE